MKRREFLGLSLATSLAAHPRRAQAEDARLLGIALGYSESDPEVQDRVQRLLDGLTSLGWVEGRNVRIEYRWATTEGERGRVAQEIVSLRPDLIVTSPTPMTRAVQKATGTIPILFVNVSDP